MKFAFDKQENYTVLSILESKLNSLIAPDLKTEFALLNNEGINNIILDLSKVDFVDSSGLSAVLIGNRLCQGGEGSFIVAAPRENVQRLFHISQLDNVLKIIPTLEEAKDYIMLDLLMQELEAEGDLNDESNDNDDDE